MRWAYGVTTVPSRRKQLLPRTLASLGRAGFNQPHLFVDGDVDSRSWIEQFKLDVTCRWPAVKTAGNWGLAAVELYIRHPEADRYAIFQDDFVTYKNLRRYLETVPYPEKGYCNLYTFPSNQELAKGRKGWYESNQFGRGAVALVFTKDALLAALTHPHLVERPQDAQKGTMKVDGGIVVAMQKAGWKEYVHNPSLVQHVGLASTIEARHDNQPQARSFKGEEFDAMELLK
jgi:hypothetical protein